jgi:uncharacterized membrane protein
MELDEKSKALLQTYLEKLRGELKKLPEKEREEIILEIKGHIEEKLAQGVELSSILKKLGAPKSYASEFVTQFFLDKGLAIKSFSLILRGMIRWGFTTLTGFFFGLLFFTLYLVSLGLVVVAILKPFFPQDVGLFIREGNLQGFGYAKGVNQVSSTEEILGYAVIPIALFLGIFIFLVTTWFLKKVIRTYLSKKEKMWC